MSQENNIGQQEPTPEQIKIAELEGRLAEKEKIIAAQAEIIVEQKKKIAEQKAIIDTDSLTSEAAVRSTKRYMVIRKG
jgi:uncharacterized coiled-coil protein SlyX